MRVAGVAGRTVTLTVRFADFTTITRSRTMPEATDVTQEIYRTAVRALRRARAAARPAPAGRGPGRGAGAARPPCTASSSSASASTAGPTPTGPSTGRPAGSAARRSSRRACSTAEDRRRSRTPWVSLVRTTASDRDRRLPTLGHIDRRAAWRVRTTGRNRCHSPKRSCDCSSRWSAPSSRRTRSSPPPCAAPRCAARPAAARSLAGVVFVRRRRRADDRRDQPQMLARSASSASWSCSAPPPSALTAIRGQQHAVGRRPTPAPRCTPPAASPSSTVAAPAATRRPRRTARAGHGSFMERMEERWRRRRENGGF